jgi:hypothetical protein
MLRENGIHGGKVPRCKKSMHKNLHDLETILDVLESTANE